MRGWYIAKGQPGKESLLSTCLDTLGVEVYYPRIVRLRRGRTVREPLFPSYLFCSLDPEAVAWPAVRWAPGLRYFLGSDGRPARVADDLVAYVRERVEAWNGAGAQKPPLRPGDRIRVSTGPFAGLEGIFQGYVTARQRCRVLLQVVGRMSPVDLPESDLDVSVSPR